MYIVDSKYGTRERDEEDKLENGKVGRGEGRSKRREVLSIQEICAPWLASLLELDGKVHKDPSDQRRGTTLSLDVQEPVGYTLSDLLSLNSIDNGVQHWGHHHIKIGQQDMHMPGNVPPKTVSQ